MNRWSWIAVFLCMALECFAPPMPSPGMFVSPGTNGHMVVYDGNSGRYGRDGGLPGAAAVTAATNDLWIATTGVVGYVEETNITQQSQIDVLLGETDGYVHVVGDRMTGDLLLKRDVMADVAPSLWFDSHGSGAPFLWELYATNWGGVYFSWIVNAPGPTKALELSYDTYTIRVSTPGQFVGSAGGLTNFAHEVAINWEAPVVVVGNRAAYKTLGRFVRPYVITNMWLYTDGGEFTYDLCSSVAGSAIWGAVCTTNVQGLSVTATPANTAVSLSLAAYQEAFMIGTTNIGDLSNVVGGVSGYLE